ncbi:unnamed protein product [Durusdinium trenchii]|uniref:Uncharacterized protein n=1 Tax=Durusdinium trenchii TaxID=1381693 RepID=A0ABP0LWZ5_9DINO
MAQGQTFPPVPLACTGVATEKEKVWYHKCPSRGKDCKPWPGNTKLTIPFGPDQKLRPRDDANWIIDEGGCCIWYDEPDLIKKVETRIGMPMKVMDPEDFSVPGVLESPLGEAGKKRIKKETVVKEPPSRRAQMRKKEEAAVVVYGAKKGDKTLAMSAKHTSALAPVVGELAALEKEIQQMFAQVMWGCRGPKIAGGISAPVREAPRSAPKPRVEETPKPTPAAEANQGPADMEVDGDTPAKRVATGWASGAGKPKRKARW